MSVFLLILKIIGIVLLSIIGFALFLVLLVLFVPVRYKGKGYYRNNEYDFKANASWLLHIVSFSYGLKEKEGLCFRLFGIKFKNSKKEDTNEPVKVDNETEKEEEEDFMSYDSLPGSDVSDSDKVPKVSTEENNDNQTVERKEKKKKNKAPKRPKKKKEKHKEKKDKQKSTFYDKIKQYYEIIQTPEFEKGFDYSKKKIGRLLKILLPKSWKVSGTVGFEDPALTGKLYEFMGIFYPIFENHLFIDGDFENCVIDVKGNFKGRISVFKVLFIGASVYFNKNLRMLYKKFKEVK